MLTYLASRCLVECQNHAKGKFHNRLYGMVRRKWVTTAPISNTAVEPKPERANKSIIHHQRGRKSCRAARGAGRIEELAGWPR
jgi:hypothetical protein